MKIERVENKKEKFKPVTVQITAETRTELDRIREMLNNDINPLTIDADHFLDQLKTAFGILL